MAGSMSDGFLQRHFANLRHIRNVFRIDSRVGRGTGQIAPWLSGIVQLVHPAFPGSFTFADPEVRFAAAPAAGADWAHTIPANEAWLIRCIRFQLVTDGTVASRQVFVNFTDSVNGFFRANPHTTQPASTTFEYSFGRMYGVTNAIGVNLCQSLPDFILDTGWVLSSAVALLQAGDQLSQPFFLVDVFPR